MPLVEMKCPNCGGEMAVQNNQFVCQHCRTMILNIVDEKINADVTIMTPDEFAREIEKSKRKFVLNINDNLSVFDIETKIINKRISDAEKFLSEGAFVRVAGALDGVPNNILSAARLRYLAELEVKNEYELINGRARYIDVDKYGRTSESYSRIIRLADEETKTTYIKLAEFCRNRCNTQQRIRSEIKKVYELLDVELYEDAVAYATEMCRRYPQTVLSWETLCDVKYKVNQNYDGRAEYEMMKRCPEYHGEVPEAVAKYLFNEKQRFNTILSIADNKKTKFLENRGAGIKWSIFSGFFFWFMILNLYLLIIVQNTDDSTFVVLFGIAFIILFIATLSSLFNMIKAKKELIYIVGELPHEDRAQYLKNPFTGRNVVGLFFASAFWIAGLVFLILLFV